MKIITILSLALLTVIAHAQKSYDFYDNEGLKYSYFIHIEVDENNKVTGDVTREELGSRDDLKKSGTGLKMENVKIVTFKGTAKNSLTFDIKFNGYAPFNTPNGSDQITLKLIRRPNGIALMVPWSYRIEGTSDWKDYEREFLSQAAKDAKKRELAKKKAIRELKAIQEKKPKYRYSVGDKVKITGWKNKSYWAGVIQSKNNGKYLVKITDVDVNGFLATQLNAEASTGNEAISFSSIGETRWIKEWIPE